MKKINKLKVLWKFQRIMCVVDLKISLRIFVPSSFLKYSRFPLWLCSSPSSDNPLHTLAHVGLCFPLLRMHSDNLGTKLFRNKVLRSVICTSTMFCKRCRAIKDCHLNVSAGRTQQSNRRVTYIMKHPLLSSLSRPLCCVEQYRADSLASCKTQTHNIQNRHGLKVTWHHWPSSIWTLLSVVLCTDAGSV